MAYASLVVVTKVIDQILPNEHHYSSICTKHQMTSLREKVVRFQEFFEHVSGRPHYSSEVDHLETRIRDAAYKMEDVVESILLWSFDIEDEADHSQLSVSPGQFACFLEQADLLLGEAMEIMKNIHNNKPVISGTYSYSHNIAATTSSSPSEQPSPTDTNVGLNDDLTKILDRITGRPTAFQVVPITGMGGIGKTTLARAVFEHPKTVGHFDIRLWAIVSQEYNVKQILQGLLPGKEKQDESVGELIVQVHKQLVGRRYLIIIDDVWDEKVWDGVRNAFPNDNNYSRVILTTRLLKVATYVSSSSTNAHQMQLLNEEQSWDLLRETVYEHKAGCPSKFEYYTGRRISRNCKGLPLALSVIGGLLKLNNAKDQWEDIVESTTIEASANDESLLKIMSLSYKNLPPHLRACFLYFGMFPEDKEISTKELVTLWCAEGFLKPIKLKTMEEVAEDCLEELVERNLVLVVKKMHDGKIKKSSIHDVLRYLSLKQAQKEKFLHRHGSREINNDTFLRSIKDQPRRVSFPKFNLESSISYNSAIRTIRTESSMDYDGLSGIIPQFMLVRVLGTVGFSSASLGISVRLNNLRYLHLRMGRRDKRLRVPKSISKLKNLETLIAKGSGFDGKYYDLYFPVEIWEMTRLQHLMSVVKMKLSQFPASSLDDSSIESMSLQTLTGVVNFNFTPRVIQKLQTLKELQIKYKVISNGDRAKVFGLENLVNLVHLEDLTISCSFESPRVRNIGFPCNLKKLRLEGTYLRWENMTSIGDLIHLQVLKLYPNAFVGRVWEPIEGGFPQLKYLKMDRLYELEEWRVESTHFPSLEKLVIMDCKRLKEVPGEIGDIDTLEKLIVKRADFFDSNKYVGDGFEESVRSVEKEQERAGNDSLQVFILSKYQKLSDVDK